MARRYSAISEQSCTYQVLPSHGFYTQAYLLLRRTRSKAAIPAAGRAGRSSEPASVDEALAGVETGDRLAEV